MWAPPVIAAPSQKIAAAARQRQAQLTKPPGSLGRLEDLACRLAAIQGCEQPHCDRVHILVFAADHGVAAHGVSAYPPEVTAQMVGNFAGGGAAIAVLARQLGAELTVVDVGVASPLPADLPIVHARIAEGTADLACRPAMTPQQCACALSCGADQTAAASAAGCRLLVPGDMGIGNTTAAAALLAVLGPADPAACIGRGTGVDDAGLARKLAAVSAARERHRHDDPFLALAGCGGFEIAAMTGAMLAAAAAGCAVLVDGFIAGAAALAACRLAPACHHYLIFAHRSREAGHGLLLERLAARPLLDLDLRLGEGSGAALAVPLLRAACAIHAEMATFAEAGISTRTAADDAAPGRG